jgi:nicotinate dehydrogenase subunit B
MTGFLHEKEFSRKSFLKGGGALIVGLSLAGAGFASRARAADGLVAGTRARFAGDQIDAWVIVHSDNTATLLTGRTEVGQGTSTGFLQIAGEELDMDMSQLKYVGEDTALTPNTGGTGGSTGIQTQGPQFRAAAAAAKQQLLTLASANLGVPVAALTVKAGVVSGGGKTVTYGQLIGDKFFNAQIPASYNLQNPTAFPAGLAPAGTEFKSDPSPVNNVTVGLAAGAPGTKPISQYTLVGTSVPRIDIPDKVTGKWTYVHNIRLPGMFHGRIVRPSGQGGYGDGTNPTLISVDESSVKHISGVQVLRKGNFVGVVAPHEYDAIQAAAQLKVKWADQPTISGSGNVYAHMREQDSAGEVSARVTENRGNVAGALANAAKMVSQSYGFAYNQRAPIGPDCCVADVKPNSAMIISNTQSAYGARDAVSFVLGLPPSSVRVRFVEGSSQYGRGGATGVGYNEPVLAAALLSQLAGKPVRLQFMRWDSMGWEFAGPVQLMDIRGGIDANGNIVGIDFTSFTPEVPNASTGAYKPGVTNAVMQQVGIPLGLISLGGAPNHGLTGAQYEIANHRVTIKSLPLLNNHFKSCPFRAPLGPQTAFGYEQFIDELAYAAKMDPYLFRKQNIMKSPDPVFPWFSTERWLGVLDAAAQAANWQPRVAASKLTDGAVATGRGISVVSYSNSLSAVVAEIEVNKKTGKVVAKHLYLSQDAGLAINPELLANQMIGGSIMATSRVLHEETRFNTKHVTSRDWVSYPILRFKDAPEVTTVVIDRKDQLSKGAGEVPISATASAIANAFFDATGVRLREAPMTPARVRGVLKAGVA